MRIRPSRTVALLLSGIALAGLACVQTGDLAGGEPVASPAPPAEPPILEEPEPLEPIPAPVRASQPPPETSPTLPDPVALEPARVPEWAVLPEGDAMDLLPVSSGAVRRGSAAPSDWKLEVVVQSGHPGDAYSVKFTPDGRFIATGGGEGSDAAVRLWDLSARKELRYVPQPYGVHYIDFSPDGSKFNALGGLFETETGKRLHGADNLDAFGDGRVDPWYPSLDWKLIVATKWDPQTAMGGLRVLRFSDKSTHMSIDLKELRPLDVSFAKNAPRFAVRLRHRDEKHHEIQVYDWSTQAQVAVVNHDGSRLLQLSADGQRLLFGQKKQWVRVVDLKSTESELWTLDRLPAKDISIPHGAGFVGDGKNLIVANSADNTLLLLDGESGELRRTFTAPGPVQAIAFDAANGTLAGSYGEEFLGTAESKLAHGIRLWGFETGEVLKDMHDDTGHAYESLDFNADGTLLASAGYRHAPAVWNVAEGVRDRQLKGDVVEPQQLGFHPGDRYLSILGGDARLRVLDLGTARTHAIIENCWDAAWDPKGKWLGIIPSRRLRSRDGAVLLWDLEKGEVERSLLAPGTQVTAFRFDAAGTRVAAVSWNAGKVLVWDCESPEPLWVADLRSPTHTAFSPDGTLVAAASMSPKSKEAGVKVFDANSGKSVADLPGDDVRRLAFSPDGRWLATADNAQATARVLLFDTSTWKQVRAFVGHDWIVTNLTFSGDSSEIISADMSGKLLAWDLGTGQIASRLEGHGFKVHDLVFNPGGTTLASSSKDGRTILWSAEDYRKQATIVVGRGQDTVISMPDGHYTMSPQAHHLVAFADRMHSYPFEQFDLRLNRPDLVIQELGRSSAAVASLFKRAWSKRVRRMGFSEASLEAGGAIPRLSILGREDLPIAQATRELTFQVRCADSSPLDRLNLFVNDVPVWGAEGRDISDEQRLEYQGEVRVRLGVGRNKIQVSCHNQAGFESLRSTFEMTCTAAERQPDCYVLAIGVSEYSQTEYSLVYAAKDARDITRAFESNDLYGKVSSKVLVDADAKRDSILAAREFLAQADVDDQVVLFVAGHGVLSEELDYYFGTHDIDFAAPAGRGLSYSALEGLVDGIPSRKKLVLMDTCHSGELESEGAELVASSAASGVKLRATRGLRVVQKSSAADLGDLLSKLFTDLRRGTGAVVVTSSSGTEFSYEDAQWANGVFSYAVLEGLRERKAGQGDRPIRASELMAYVGQRVTELTGGMQTPTMRRDNLELDFPIWR